jgi:hypothetical protein
MKFSAMLAVLTVLFAVCFGIGEFRVANEYSNAVGSYWDLSDKSSTLKQKSEYLDKYVAALSQPGKFAPNDATIYATLNNSFDQNMIALVSLQGRMHEIDGMDTSSFAYQTAIQQITAQEQGEARSMTSTFEGCWYLRNHSLFWGWHDGLIWGAIVLMFVLVFLSFVAAT